jgi:hypothetical protein
VNTKADAMNKAIALLSLCLLGCNGLRAQDYLFAYKTSVTFGSGGSFQNPLVAPEGDRVYMADSYLGVIVWDASVPSHPVPVGEYRPAEGTFLADIAASGSLVYVLDNSDYSLLRILDFADPAAAVELGVLGGADANPPLNYPSHIEQVGSLCFLWQEFGDFYVVDVSNPASPVIRSTLSVNEAPDMVARDGRLFFAMGSEGLVIMDASDPSSLVEVGNLPLNEFQYAQEIHLEGNTAYLGTSDGLQVVDVSTPSNPVLLDSIADAYAGSGIATSGGFIFLNQFHTLQVVDYRNPEAVIDHGQIPFPSAGGASQIARRGDHLIFGSPTDGLIMADISQPPQVRFLATTRGMSGGQDYETDGGLGLIVDGFGGITGVDETDPENPFNGNTLNLPGHCSGVARSGSLAYVAAGYGGLHIVDVVDPMEPSFVSTVTTPGQPLDVAVFNDRLWVADGEQGLSVFDLSMATSPTLITTLALTGSAEYLTLAPPYAYIATRPSLVSIVNIADASSPSIVATMNTVGSAMRPQVSGDRLLLPEGSAGAEVFDVSTVASPQSLVQLDFGEEVLGLGQVDGYLWAVLPNTRMVLLDISNPDEPSPHVDVVTGISSGRLYSTGNGWITLDSYSATHFDGGRNPVFQSIETWPGHRAGMPRKLKASADRLFATAGDSLLVYDLSVPESPRFVASFIPAEFATLMDLAVTGNTVYVGGFQQLLSYDLSDPAFPALLGTVYLANGTQQLALESDWILAGNDFDEGLSIVDVSDPSNLVHLGTYYAPVGFSGAAARKGDIIYAESFGGTVDIVDASDPSAPTRLSSVDTDAFDYSQFDVVGDWLIVAGDGYGLANIVNPTMPIPLFSGWEEGQFTADMHAFSDYLYFADSNLGLMIVDLTNPLSPSTASVTSAGLSYATSIQVVGDHAYVADDQGIHVFDVTDRTQPAALHVIPTSVRLTALDVAGALAVGSNGLFNELIMLDVTDPAAPRLLSRNMMDAPVHNLQVVGNHVILANDFRGLAIWDISDPTQPVEVGLSGASVALDVAAVGDYAYVAGGDGGLTVFDIHNRGMPTPVMTQPTSNRAERVFVQDGRAYVLMGYSGLEVYDVSAPENPVLVGAFSEVFDETLALAVQGDRLYVGSGSTVQVVDFSDPGSPVDTGPTVYLNHEVQGLHAQGNKLLAATGSRFSFEQNSEMVQIDYSRQDQWGEPLTTPYAFAGNIRDFVLRDDRLFLARDDYGLTTLHMPPMSVTQPVVAVARVPAGITVSWPEGYEGFFLESSETLPAVQWKRVPGGDVSGFTLPTSSGNALFLRLRAP